ncbi:hypothetical protein [Actinophytocola sp. NPDC049390]|uniref:hypothetical protein n=1 Tax=Actinophytocola sp. NPDC049390 TaxID=3363894 RepID=UPI0037A627A6
MTDAHKTYLRAHEGCERATYRVVTESLDAPRRRQRCRAELGGTAHAALPSSCSPFSKRTVGGWPKQRFSDSHGLSGGDMSRTPSPRNVPSDDVLMREVMVVSTLIGRYLLTLLDTGRDESSVDDEMALATRVASVARSVHARAAGRRAAAGRVSAASDAEALAVLQPPVRSEVES